MRCLSILVSLKTLINIISLYSLIGGEAIIECVTSNVISRPEYVLWTFNGKVITGDILQGGVC